MSEARDMELRRLTDTLCVMAGEAKRPDQVEALRKAAAALCLIFTKGSWQELEGLNGPMTEEMKKHFRRMGLDPEWAKS
jgi:hypothetical protein